MDQIPSGKKSAPPPKQEVADKPADKPNEPTAPQLSALEQQYQQNTDGYSPVKFDGANLTDIFKNLTGVFDYGEGIGDFEDAKADLKGKTSFKEGETISIGGKDYKIVKSEDGFVYLKDTKSTRNGEQIYILEKTPSGSYQLSQRTFTNTAGFGKAAW